VQYVGSKAVKLLKQQVSKWGKHVQYGDQGSMLVAALLLYLPGLSISKHLAVRG
jgi:hypothetical protein